VNEFTLSLHRDRRQIFAEKRVLLKGALWDVAKKHFVTIFGSFISALKADFSISAYKGRGRANCLDAVHLRWIVWLIWIIWLI